MAMTPRQTSSLLLELDKEWLREQGVPESKIEGDKPLTPAQQDLLRQELAKNGS